MRRIAQLATIDIVKEVREPSFIDLEDNEGDLTAEQQLEEERNFALNEVIASWEENGWQLADGVKMLWVRAERVSRWFFSGSGAGGVVGQTCHSFPCLTFCAWL